MPEKLPAEEARQGRRGFHVLAILAAGLLLAMVAWMIAEIYGWTIEDEDQAITEQTDTVPADGNSTPDND